MNTLVWFQRDLRIEDNLALNWAINRGTPIVAVFIHSPKEDAPWQIGPASSWWLHHSLKNLTDNLNQHGIQLRCFSGNSQQIIPELISKHEVDAVVWTNRHEPMRIKIENNIEKTLIKNQIIVKRVRDELLSAPDSFLTKTNQTPYKVFTPFYKRLRNELCITKDFEKISSQQWQACSSPATENKDSGLDKLSLLGQNNWYHKLSAHWMPGENTASEKLNQFISDCLETYSVDRDFPSIQGTSALSPHLLFGEISPRQIFKVLSPFLTFFHSKQSNNAESFLRQLIWREFARYILWHFPETTIKPMNAKFKSDFWASNKTLLSKWQQGQTGVEIIDAGMKQLLETGWMHNRVRMLSASFLTKNLGIPWQEGAKWFWDTLVDADLANNSMGWQWVAGCGVDAAPYFRIFNPYTQTKRFDKNKSYIKQWIDLKNSALSPQAIIDVKQSRADALLRYKHIIRDNKISRIQVTSAT